MSQQPIIEHEIHVIRICEDRRIVGPQRWFFTVSRDAIRIYTSFMFETMEAAVAAAKGAWK
jgi:hypothetical protein